jgi:hypothetical protein
MCECRHCDRGEHSTDFPGMSRMTWHLVSP